MSSKYTLQVSPKMEKVLEELADAQGLSKAHVIRRALGLMKYLEDAREEGASVRIHGKDGTEREIVFETDLVRG